MALRTALIIDGDSSGGQQALAGMEQAIERAEKEARQLAAAYAAADIATSRFASAQTAAKAQTDATKAAFKAGEIGLDQYNRELLETKTALGLVAVQHRESIATLKQSQAAYDQAAVGMGNVNAVSGQTRMGMQQLGMQLNDVATMFALGARPQQIFASQSGQVIQAVQMMTGGTSKLAGFLGGPWGLAITSAAAVLSPFIAKLFETSGALADVEARAWSAIDALRSASKESTLSQIGQATGELTRLQEQQQRLQRQLGEINDPHGNLQRHSGPYQQLFAVNQQILAAQDAINRGNAEMAAVDRRASEEMIASRAKLAGATTALDRAQAQYAVSIQEAERAYEKSGKTEAAQARLLQARTAAERDLNQAQDAARSASAGRGEARRLETLARQSEATEALIGGLYHLADAYLASDAAAMRAEVEAKAREQGIRKQADLTAYVDQQLRLSVAQQAADAAKAVNALRGQSDAQQILNSQVAQGLLTSEQAAQVAKDEAVLRPHIAALAIAEGDAKQKLAGIIANLRDQQARANDETRRAQELALLERHRDQQTLLAGEIGLTRQLGEARLAALSGLNGGKLEDELARISAEREKATIRLQAETEATRLERDGMHDLAAKVRQAAEAQADLIDLELKFDSEEAALGRLNDELRDMAGLLGNIGGFAGVIGGAIGGLSTGDFSGLGPLGAIFNTVLAAGNRDPGEKGPADVLGEKLEKIFGIDGQFAKSLGTALQGAGIGLAAGNAIFGQQNSLEQLGAGIGGALGQVGGEAIGKALGSALGSLGSAAGPIGAVVGSILGSVLGSALSSTPRGSATIGDAGGALGVVGTSGNSSARIAAASKSAGAIVTSLADLAAELGATLDPSRGRVSIGIRDGNYRVDTSGSGKTKTKKGAIDFGQDAEAAAYFAMLDLIKDGVLVGLRRGTETLLRNATDLEAGIRKALAFEGAFDMIEAAGNPLFAEMRDLRKNFGDLEQIFREAGASTQEFAQLQAEQQRQLRELIEDAGAGYRDAFFTDEQNAAFARQQISRTLTPLGYGGVDTVDEYTALVNGIDTTTEAGMKLYGSLVSVADQFALLRDLGEDASDGLATAAAIARQRAELEIELLRLQGRETEALARARQLELEALDPSLRALMQEVQAWQEVADARDELSDAYRREKDELDGTIDRMSRLGNSLREFRAGLFGGEDAVDGYAAALARLRETGRLAGLGDEAALEALPSAGREFLEAARDRAGTIEEYRRAQALAARYADSAIGAADTAVTLAQEQLEAMKAEVGALIDINENVVTVREAIEELQRLTALAGGPFSGVAALYDQAQPTAATADTAQSAASSAELREEIGRLAGTIDQLGVAQDKMARILSRVERDGALAVVTDADAPLLTQVVT